MSPAGCVVDASHFTAAADSYRRCREVTQVWISPGEGGVLPGEEAKVGIVVVAANPAADNFRNSLRVPGVHSSFATTVEEQNLTRVKFAAAMVIAKFVEVGAQ
jgi:hypothetical protein